MLIAITFQSIAAVFTSLVCRGADVAVEAEAANTAAAINSDSPNAAHAFLGIFIRRLLPNHGCAAGTAYI